VDCVLKPVQTRRLAQCCARPQTALRLRAASDASAESTLQATLSQLRGLLATPATAALASGQPVSTGALEDAVRSTAEPSPAPTRLSVIQAGIGAAIHMVPVDEVLHFEAADN